MRRTIRTLSALLVAAATLVLVAGQLPASAAGTYQGVIPSAVPGLTPHIADGSGYKVLDMAKVGTRIVVVGQFAQVQNPSSTGAPTGPLINRADIFSFDPGSGLVDVNFAPSVTGGVIDAVAAGPNNTVYIGGTFGTVNGVTVRRLAQLNLADGSTVAAFKPTVSAEVTDLKLLGSRLFLAGSFLTVGGQPHGGLAAVDATTGRVDPYMSLDVAGHHNYGIVPGAAQSSVGVAKIDIDPLGDRMIAIGNFRTVAGNPDDQVASIDLQSTGAVVDTNWQAPGYQAPCKASAFDSWVRDVQWSPDGSYFVIASTGAYGSKQLCDTAARFNATDSGLAVQPSWIAYTGGDSLFSVAVTDVAVYVGGHPRWLNNPFVGDNVGTGAVPRPGVAALDPLNGLPLSWNPGRNPRGAPLGAQSILATDAGVYVGSDTNTIGSPKVQTYTRKKLAFFPLAGGTTPLPQTTGTLPGTFYLAGNVGGVNSSNVVHRTSDGTATGTSGDSPAATGGTAWTTAHGAFMVANQLFYGIKDPSSATYMMARRTFTNGSFGPETILSTPYKDPAWDGVSTGTTNGGTVYDGVYPDFYGPFTNTNSKGVTVSPAGELPTVTGMFYWQGRVYYTKSGSGALYYRYFSVDSGIVGAQSFTAASSGFSTAGGMFLNGSDLYVVNRSTGNLTKMTFNSGVPSGPAAVVDSTHNWKANALWFDSSDSPPPPPVNHNPVAALATPSCTGLTCTFDASASSDPDSDTLSYAWDFGDGSTQAAGTSPTTSHTYAAAGNRTVTVTVTDGRGGSDTATATANPTTTTTTGNVAFRAAVGTSTLGGASIAVTVPSTVQPGDALVLVASNNGGSTLGTAGVTGTAPSGWTQVGIADSLVGAAGSNVSMRTQVFEKVATSADAGSNVTVTLSSGAKASLQLIAYSGAVGVNPVRATGQGQNGGTSHTTPSVTANAGDWVLSVWGDKAGVAETWSAPSGESTRNSIASSGTSGEIASLAGDPGAPIATTGTVPGRAATVGAADAKAVVFSVVIAGS